MNLRSCLPLVFCGLLQTVSAQVVMPQDSWRYDGVEFASPEPDKYLRCIGIGSGGVYAGEGTNISTTATRILQFTEGGAFVRRFDAVFGFILGIACDTAGNVYVLDREDAKVKAFTSDGTFLRDWGGSGNANGQFSFGTPDEYNMIALDPADQVYVCDPGNRRVQVFDTSGNFLRKWGDPGSLPGQFAANDPSGLTIAPDGRVILSCNGSPQIRVFDPQGQFLSSTPNYGKLGRVAITPDGLLVGGNSTFYVLDPKFAAIGTFSSSTIYGLATNRRGDIYFLRSDMRRVRVLEREYSNVHNTLLPSAIPQPAVTRVAQRAGMPLLDIDYKVTDADSSTVSTAALAFLNGNNTLSDVIPMKTFVEGTSANIGANQTAGVEKRITWDMAADWSVDFAQIEVEVLAKDDRNPLGIHWITVPAEGDQPALEVSRAPLTDAQLLSVWYWFVANGESGLNFSNGQVRAAGGAYGNSMLASGTSTTNTGRIFAYQKLGFRGITAGEISRTLAGNYGFSSVTSNSVVRQALAPSSVLSAWGSNGWGETTLSPGLASSEIVALAAGSSYSLFVTSNGALLGLGYNGNGQLGDGTTTSRNVPVQVATGVTQISARSYHSLFLKTDGSLWAMGNNDYGQLGDGTTTRRSTPAQIVTGVSEVTAGDTYSLFVKTDGTLWAMGSNGYGQLGDGTTTNRGTPVQVTSGVSRVAAGDLHTLFLKTDGTLWAMGYNDYGQLGDGTTTRRSTPVQIATGVSKVTAGSYHTFFVKTDGTLWAMGNNGSGQLGDGTTTRRSTPLQIATGVSEVTAGSDHSLFIKTDGTLWAMGSNRNGQLGDGTTTQRNLPVQIGMGARKVAAGVNHTLAVFGAP